MYNKTIPYNLSTNSIVCSTCYLHEAGTRLELPFCYFGAFCNNQSKNARVSSPLLPRERETSQSIHICSRTRRVYENGVNPSTTNQSGCKKNNDVVWLCITSTSTFLLQVTTGR